ncbi:MAG: VWA domain-containing protein [Planctomycetota bacterium]
MNSTRPLFKNRKAAVVVLFALLLPVLLVIFGFTIDYANMQRVRAESQVIADLSAKTACNVLSTTNDTLAAANAAKVVASGNTIAGTAHQLRDQDIEFGNAVQNGSGGWDFSSGGTPYNSVRVMIKRDATTPDGGVNLFFGALYGQPNFDLEQTATASFRELDICLVLDRSGSMKRPAVGTLTSAEWLARVDLPPQPDSRFVAVLDAVDVFVTALATTANPEQLAGVTYASDATLDESITFTHSNVTTAFRDYSLNPMYGGTETKKGIEEARKHLEAIASGRDQIIVLLTDGTYDGGNPFDEAAKCADKGIQVYTISFGDDANQADMQQIAASGNGEHYHASDPAELSSVFKRLAGDFTILID